MALDGITIAALADELSNTLTGARISHIAEPEPDEVLLTCKGKEQTIRLILCVNASVPYVCLTKENHPSPKAAPSFVMVLRKHIGGGRIISIRQPGLERILILEIEHLDEMSDRSRKFLIAELMGRHSNLILTDEKETILDSIRHVSSSMSSLRQVLPGRPYFLAGTQANKADLLTLASKPDAKEQLSALLGRRAGSIKNAVYGSLIGISPVMAAELAFRAGLDGDAPMASVSDAQRLFLSEQILQLADDVKEKRFSPQIILCGGEVIEFSAVPLFMYADCTCESCACISYVIETFYAQKAARRHMQSKSADLRHITNTLLERCVKKYDLQMQQLAGTADREKDRIRGELLQAYGYGVPQGAEELTVPNYYDNDKPLLIPLDPTLSAQENAVRFFAQYGKKKRTYEALSVQIKQTQAQINHLKSVQASLDLAADETDLMQIREELIQTGYLRRRSPKGKKAPLPKSRPLHYRTPDGYDLYVGKNNAQNDELTFDLASGGDWWFHVKGIPGSHVIAKNPDGTLPDCVFEAAASLAAFYSKGRDSEKVEVDYVQRKHVKKPNGSAPGFVIYDTHYSLLAKPQIGNLTLLS